MAFGGQVVLAHDLTGSQFRPTSRQRPAARAPAPWPRRDNPNGDRMPVMHAVSH